jgi:hypothetical protein
VCDKRCRWVDLHVLEVMLLMWTENLVYMQTRRSPFAVMEGIANLAQGCSAMVSGRVYAIGLGFTQCCSTFRRVILFSNEVTILLRPLFELRLEYHERNPNRRLGIHACTVAANQ